MFCGECGFSVAPRRVTPTVPVEIAPEPVEAPPAVPAAPPPVPVATVPVSAKAPAVPVFVPPPVVPVIAPVPVERFVLQFSTGESVIVTGTGIIGRNPSAEPGEFVDHLVTVVDYDKSVSKSHLDFGQEDGRFWVSDRFSANGTTVREPDREARRCVPGSRFHVVRGTRIDMGDQFFVVS
jgi:hypothetical protein